MGYRDKNGVVGKYRGCNVYVIDYEDLKPASRDDYTIYAVRFKQDKILTLMQKNKKIGYMNDAGEVDLTDTVTPFDFYWAPAKEEPKAEKEKEKDIFSEDIDYSRYSAVVDKFFAELGL